MRQRLLFALALCGDPSPLVLDEPAVGMDVATRGSIWECIRARVQRGCTVVLTTHYLEEMEVLADRVVVLNRGTVLAAGTGPEIKATSCSLEEAFLSIV